MTNEKLQVINQLKEIYTFFSSIKKFSELIPEVRTNISIAISNPKSREDIAAVEGRITVIGGFPMACGGFKFGVSDHTARILLTTKEHDPSLNIVMNLKYSPELVEKLQNHPKFEVKELIREIQPKGIKETERSTMQWLIKECIKEVGHIPDIIFDTGAKGKEPMIRLFAANSDKMITKLGLILDLIRD